MLKKIIFNIILLIVICFNLTANALYDTNKCNKLIKLIIQIEETQIQISELCNKLDAKYKKVSQQYSELKESGKKTEELYQYNRSKCFNICSPDYFDCQTELPLTLGLSCLDN